MGGIQIAVTNHKSLFCIQYPFTSCHNVSSHISYNDQFEFPLNLGYFEIYLSFEVLPIYFYKMLILTTFICIWCEALLPNFVYFIKS